MNLSISKYLSTAVNISNYFNPEMFNFKSWFLNNWAMHTSKFESTWTEAWYTFQLQFWLDVNDFSYYLFTQMIFQSSTHIYLYFLKCRSECATSIFKEFHWSSLTTESNTNKLEWIPDQSRCLLQDMLSYYS